jgi:putative transposase
MKNPFRYFDSSAEVIRLVVMMYVRFPLPLWNVDALLAECGIAIHQPGRLQGPTLSRTG